MMELCYKDYYNSIIILMLQIYNYYILKYCQFLYYIKLFIYQEICLERLNALSNFIHCFFSYTIF